jgi:hypothetical protein
VCPAGASGRPVRQSRAERSSGAFEAGNRGPGPIHSRSTRQKGLSRHSTEIHGCMISATE